MKIRVGQLTEMGGNSPASADRMANEDLCLEAMGGVVAAIMHEMNNVLNSIMASAYLLQQSPDSPDAVLRHASRIIAAVESNEALALPIRSFVRQQLMDLSSAKVVDLSLLMAGLSEDDQLQLPAAGAGDSGVDLKLDLRPDTRILGVEGSVRRLLVNIIRNALDAMPRGGDLVLGCDVEGGVVSVTVRDSGVGMSPAVMSRALEPFFTTHHGTRKGLGLAEAYGIVRSHGAVMELDSAEGSGTTVVLRFPAVPESREAAAGPRSVEARGGPRRVLLVEDHVESRALMRRILEGEGHVVDDVGSLKEARELLLSATGGPAYDVMLTDLDLPDGSGVELIREVRVLNPALSIGVVSGWQPSVSDTDLSGIQFVLHKPLRVDELKAHIWNVNIC